MGLFDAFRRQPKIAPWLQNLQTIPLYAIYLNENRVFPNNDGSAEAFNEWLMRNAQETNDLQEAALFQYPEAGLILVPVFTNQDYVSPWLKRRSYEYPGFTTMTVLTMKPGRLFKNFAGVDLQHMRVIVDPAQDQERILKAEEMRWLIEG
jgi:hypothetical protein